jgi:tetratricopeptide (TPR) repeat protein
MGRVGCAAVLALFVAACAPTAQERVHEFNEAGARLFQNGEYDHARAEFEAALMLQPNDAALLYNIGQCYERLGQTRQAEQVYRESLQQDANRADCRHALTALMVNGGRFAEARAMVQDWLDSAPKCSAAYVEDGWLYHKDGDPIKALKRYQQAIEFDPYHNRALVEMGAIYEELNYPERALLLYQTALDHNERDAALVQRVKLLRSRGTGHPHPDS